MSELHRCIFKGDDLKEFSQLLRTQDVSQKDKHGAWQRGNISLRASHCAISEEMEIEKPSKKSSGKSPLNIYL